MLTRVRLLRKSVVHSIADASTLLRACYICSDPRLPYLKRLLSLKQGPRLHAGRPTQIRLQSSNANRSVRLHGFAAQSPGCASFIVHVQCTTRVLPPLLNSSTSTSRFIASTHAVSFMHVMHSIKFLLLFLPSTQNEANRGETDHRHPPFAPAWPPLSLPFPP